MKKFLFMMFFITSISLPAQTTSHIVQRGETMESVAKKYGISVEDLKNANPEIVDCFFSGLTLSIPEIMTKTSTTNYANNTTSLTNYDDFKKAKKQARLAKWFTVLGIAALVGSNYYFNSQTNNNFIPTYTPNTASYSSDYLTSRAYIVDAQARANQVTANSIAQTQQRLQQYNANMQKRFDALIKVYGELNAWCVKFESQTGQPPTEMQKNEWVRRYHPDIYQDYMMAKTTEYERTQGVSGNTTTESHEYDNSGHERIKREAVEKLKEHLPSEKECDGCGGSGNCSTCNGKGWVTRLGSQDGPCAVCYNHNGKCRRCGGKGTRIR